MKKLRKGQVRIQNILSSEMTGTYNDLLQTYTTEKSRKTGFTYVRVLKIPKKKK